MRYLSALLFCTIGLGQQNAVAQTAELATATFERCVNAQSSGEQAEIAASLLECYKSNLALLQTALTNSQDYALAYNNLLQIWPNLAYAASYYSREKQNDNAVYMAEAYVGMPLMDAFRGHDFTYAPIRAQYTIFVASSYYNKHQYAAAIPFLELYMRIGDANRRKDVASSLVNAYIAEERTQEGLKMLDDLIQSYPNDFDLIVDAVVLCKQIHAVDEMQIYLDKALSLQPFNTQLLEIQANLDEDKAKQYEANQDYAKAAALYSKLLLKHPNSLEYTKHMALNRYNLGVVYVNEAINETNSRTKKNLVKLAKMQFTDVLEPLITITQNDPTSIVFNIALATTYAQLGQTSDLKAINKNLASMGVGKVDAGTIPQAMDLNGNSIQSYLAQNQSGSKRFTATGAVPRFSIFAKEMIESEIKRWQLKDPYETTAEFQARVNEKTREDKVAELRKKAEEDYISAYATTLTPASFKLKPYDAENGVFLVEGSIGNLVVPVPRTNDEARLFEKSWKDITLQDPQYRIVNDKLALAALTFITPTGNSYQYKSDKLLSYTETKVDVNFDAIDYAQLANNSAGGQSNIKQEKLKVGLSDVDIDIPLVSAVVDATPTFALIIANEQYKYASSVPFAEHDGEIFAEYCKKTLSIPDNRVFMFKNASLNEMKFGIKKLIDALSARKGEAKAVVYYAGHGIPSESTHAAFLLPNDGFTSDASTGYSLSEFYKSLAAVQSQGITVFMDACFSGMSREGESLETASRGAGIKAKKENTSGKVVSLSAATGEQTAWPYKKEQHGLFTYFLLKKLKESSGEVTLGELADYISTNVQQQSIEINSKLQTPTVSAPEQMGEEWKGWKLN